MHHGAQCNMAIAECGRLLVGEAVDDPHDDRTHAPTRPALGGGDDAGLAGGAAALVALAAKIDVVGFHNRRPAALSRRPQLAALALFRHRVAQTLVQIPRGRIADAQTAAEFDPRDALLGAAHQVHGPEPGCQRQLGVGHHYRATIWVRNRVNQGEKL